MTPRPLRLDPNRFTRLRQRPALTIAEVEAATNEVKTEAVALAADYTAEQMAALQAAAAADAQAKANAAKTAALAAIPPFTTATPMPESTAGSPGAMAAVPRGDHEHPRLTSTTGPHTLDATGRVVVNFTRVFSSPPGIALTRVVDTDVQERPVEFQATFVVVLGSYTGVIIRGRRAAVLPTLTPLSTSALLTGVITGVNATTTALSGFDVFGTPAAGVKFTCIAVKSSA